MLCVVLSAVSKCLRRTRREVLKERNEEDSLAIFWRIEYKIEVPLLKPAKSRWNWCLGQNTVKTILDLSWLTKSCPKTMVTLSLHLKSTYYWNCFAAIESFSHLTPTWTSSTHSTLSSQVEKLKIKYEQALDLAKNNDPSSNDKFKTLWNG